jgi:hypothetical protein
MFQLLSGLSSPLKLLSHSGLSDLPMYIDKITTNDCIKSLVKAKFNFFIKFLSLYILKKKITYKVKFIASYLLFFLELIYYP